MTAPEPSPVELWVTRLARTLADAAALAGALAGAIAKDWTDSRGPEWAERAGLVHRELERDAAAAAQVSAALTGDPAATDPATVVTAIASAALSAPQRRGVRLGDTLAQRIDEERGMRIAQLPAD